NFVRLSVGGMKRPAKEMKSEVDIITSIGARLLPENGPIDFRSMGNHDEIRAVMARVVPGYEKIAEITATQKEFLVRSRVRHEPRFPLPEGRAQFKLIETPSNDLEPGQLRLMTIRSEGQFNTVVYEEHDRYRNQPSRDVILMHASDIEKLGLRANQRVT